MKQQNDFNRSVKTPVVMFKENVQITAIPQRVSKIRFLLLQYNWWFKQNLFAVINQ